MRQKLSPNLSLRSSLKLQLQIAWDFSTSVFLLAIAFFLLAVSEEKVPDPVEEIATKIEAADLSSELPFDRTALSSNLIPAKKVALP
ncbi:MAG: hypothetical protein AAFR61_07175 [Bacteroidota bacterium]